MKYEINNRFTTELIFSEETTSWKLAVEAAIKSNANLSEADLSKANLFLANLSKANLSEADLSIIRNDFWAVLLFAKNEVPALRQAIVDGKIDGSTYEGDCA